MNFSFKQWLLFNFLGWLSGTILVLILSATFDSIGIEYLQFYVATGIGAGIGLGQWLFLRRYLTITSNWITLTIIGLTIPFIIADVLKHFLLLDLKSFFIPTCAGFGSILVGLFQGKILEKYKIKLFNWVLISFFSWTLIAAAVHSIEFTSLISKNVWFGFIANLLLLLSGGFILGIIPGNHLRNNLKIQ